MTAFWHHNFTTNPKIILEDNTIIDLFPGKNIDEYFATIASVIYNYDIHTLKVEDETLVDAEEEINALLVEQFAHNEPVRIEVL